MPFDFDLIDLIDIFLVSLLIYQLYKLVKGTVAIRISLGVAALYLSWKLVELLDMTLLTDILGKFINVGVLALIIVFQQEIRKFLLLIGNKSFGSRKDILKRFQKAESSQQNLTTELILDAVKHLSSTKTGSILVFKAKTDLSFIEETGTLLNAKVSSELIESIFFKNSPLHDGATIIDHQKITHATCVLPVSDRRDLPTIFGLRHRAALGLSESTDALILVISEETGRISICKEGELLPNLSIEDCRTLISKN